VVCGCSCRVFGCRVFGRLWCCSCRVLCGVVLVVCLVVACLVVCGVVLVVCCVVLFLSCVCVCDLFFFLQHREAASLCDAGFAASCGGAGCGFSLPVCGF